MLDDFSLKFQLLYGCFMGHFVNSLFDGGFFEWQLYLGVRWNTVGFLVIIAARIIFHEIVWNFTWLSNFTWLLEFTWLLGIYLSFEIKRVQKVFKLNFFVGFLTQQEKFFIEKFELIWSFWKTKDLFELT